MSTSSSGYDHQRDRPIAPARHRRVDQYGESNLNPQEQESTSDDRHADSLFGKVGKVPMNAVVMDRDRIIKVLSALDVALVDHPFLMQHPEIKATLRIVGGLFAVVSVILICILTSL